MLAEHCEVMGRERGGMGSVVNHLFRHIDSAVGAGDGDTPPIATHSGDGVVNVALLDGFESSCIFFFYQVVVFHGGIFLQR